VTSKHRSLQQQQQLTVGSLSTRRVQAFGHQLSVRITTAITGPINRVFQLLWPFGSWWYYSKVETSKQQ
jgi:hypothetical protein